MAFYVYILECYIAGEFKCYYTGQTNNLKKRLQQHYKNVKKHNTNKFTGRFDFVKHKWNKEVPTIADAYRLERYLKSLSPEEKEDYMDNN